MSTPQAFTTTSLRSRLSRIGGALLLVAAMMLAGALPATAQGYEGSDSESGIFSAPGGVTVPGDSVSFTATGLAPNAIVFLELVDELGNPVVDTSNDLTATVSAGPGGTVEAAVPIPDDLAPGNYTILADSEKLDGSAFHAEFAFSVSSEAQPEADPVDGSDDAANGPDLAFTGASSLALAVSASMLIVLGGGLVLSTKRETTDS